MRIRTIWTIAALLVILSLAGGATLYVWRGREAHAPEPNAVPTPPATKQTAPAPDPGLAAVQLSPQQMQSIGVETGVVRRQVVTQDIRAVGNVDVDERLLSSVQLRFSGWIQQVFVNSNYQFVHRGEPLFTIYSPDLLTTEQEYLIASRNQLSLAHSPVPGVAEGAQSLAEAALQRLEQWQVPLREIERLKRTGKPQRLVEIDAPASGYVTARNALPNAYAQPSTVLYSIAGLSTVWVNAQLYQDQIGGVSPGDGASITVDTFPGRVFHGVVDFVYPVVDPTSRTVKVRFALPNPESRLKPGMFVNVDLRKPLGTQVVIPASGVLQTGTRQIAFLARGDGYLQPQAVELGPMVGDNYIVRKGLKPGQRIVTSANFLIDSESQMQSALGSFAPPPPGAGMAAAMNQPAGQLTFTTSPTPPQKGTNTWRVRLTGSDGRPIEGASVSITFNMPAMPAMGMAAIRQQFTLADHGGGDYEATGALPTGGAWQVIVVARKGGQVIASKQLSVTAAGGM